jgi:hypothetical protein
MLQQEAGLAYVIDWKRQKNGPVVIVGGFGGGGGGTVTSSQ